MQFRRFAKLRVKLTAGGKVLFDSIFTCRIFKITYKSNVSLCGEINDIFMLTNK